LEKFKDRLKVVALLIVCLGIPVIAWSLTRIVRGAPDAKIPNPTYAELIGIVLASVTAVLAVLAIVIAILAVWGYKSIKDEAALAADRAVKSTVQESVEKHVSDEAIEKHVARMIKRRVDRIVGDGLALYPKAFDVQGDDPQHGSVGTAYPKDEGNDER
jgi:hypothetical protein